MRGFTLPRTQTSLFWWKCTRKGRRDPSHGPLRFITSHSFRAPLCHAKNEALEEEAGIHWFRAWTEYQTEGRFMWKVYIHAVSKISGFVWTWLFTIVSLYKNDQNNFIFPFFSYLRSLDWIFWGWYLQSLSINYVGISKDMEERLPQLYYIKMKITYDLGFVALGVAMAT